jgi:PhnB protein
MVTNPPDDFPRITPYLLYEDLDNTVDWLINAFGFSERFRMPDADGKLTHAELQLGDGVVMMGHPGPDYKNPKHLGASTQLVYVYVDDVDAHCERARAAGARITEEPQDMFCGDRRYAAEDSEGHVWNFAARVKAVPPEAFEQ